MAVLTRWNFVVLVLTLQALLVEECVGCHHGREDKEKEGDKEVTRTKRQAPELPLEDYFAQCLGRNQYSEPYDMQTIVDYTIRQTSWYSKTDKQYCVGDTVDCWRYIANDYLRGDSQLLQPVKRCMEQYGRDRGEPAMIRDLRPGSVSQVPRATVRLNVDRNLLEQQIRQQFVATDPSDQSFRDIPSLINFFRDNTICALDFCDCTGINIPPGELCGQHWYTRMAALTRLDSPIRPLMVTASNAIVSNAIIIPQPVPQPSLTPIPPITPLFQPSGPDFSFILELLVLINQFSITDAPATQPSAIPSTDPITENTQSPVTNASSPCSICRHP